MNQILKNSQTEGFLTVLDNYKNKTSNEKSKNDKDEENNNNNNKRSLMFKEGEMLANATASTLHLLSRKYTAETVQDLLSVSNVNLLININFKFFFIFVRYRTQ